MSQLPPRRQLNPQRTYRKRQAQKNLVRYELQVNAQSKARFEAMAAEVAEEYAEPWDKPQRLAKARTHLFDKVTQGR